MKALKISSNLFRFNIEKFKMPKNNNSSSALKIGAKALKPLSIVKDNSKISKQKGMDDFIDKKAKSLNKNELKKEIPKTMDGKVIHSGKVEINPEFVDFAHIDTNNKDNIPDIAYYPNFLNEEEQIELMKNLKENVPWQRVTYQKFGKERKTPRKTFCYGTPQDGKSIEVQWKGNKYLTETIPNWLQVLKSKIENKMNNNKKFNAVIMNNYESEEDYISWHQDDEKFLEHTIVASISMGSVRNFRVKRGSAKIVHEIPLQIGSLAVLINGIEHTLPKRSAKELAEYKPRFNITFRCLKTEASGKNKACGFGNYYMYGRGLNYQINKKEKSKVTDDKDNDNDNKYDKEEIQE